jgi:hypothetical protein
MIRSLDAAYRKTPRGLNLATATTRGRNMCPPPDEPPTTGVRRQENKYFNKLPEEHQY